MPKRVVLLMFASLLTIQAPPCAPARDVGSKTIAKDGKEKNAIVVPFVRSYRYDNAILDLPEVVFITPQDAPATYAGILTTPTVEVKAIVTVRPQRHRRLCGSYTDTKKISATRSGYNWPILHINPGLRGC